MAVIKTTKESICDYWLGNIPASETQLNFDWSDCREHCWNCGKNNRYAELDRAHIISSSLGGEDRPSNFVLLCKQCHKNSPDTSNVDDMWHWIKKNKKEISFYDMPYATDKALKAISFENGYSSIIEMLTAISLILDNIDEFKKIMKGENVGQHWGVGIVESSQYYMFKRVIEKYLTFE